MSDDETKVFASAKPVSPADLVDNETETKTETPKSEAETRKKASQAKAETGVPTWHLSLTLGLVIALVGGTLLWLYSPALAILVIGGLILLVGLSLAVRHFFGRRAAQSQNGARTPGGAQGNGPRGAGGPSGSPAAGPQSQSRRRRSQQHETGSETGKSRSRQPETAARSRDRQRETGGRDRSQKRETPNRGPAGTRTHDGPRTPPKGQAPQGARTPQGGRTPGGSRPTGGRPTGPGRQNALGGSAGGIPPRPPKTIREAAPVCDRGIKPIEPKSPEPSKPSKIKDIDDEKQPIKPPPVEAKTEKTERPEPPPSKPADAKVETAKTPETKEDIVWPNVDVDDPRHLPRITMARKATKLPPIYHRKGEPSWPADDPDRQPVVVPPQRDRRGTVATPDQLTSAQRAQRWANAAATATKLAEEKEAQAYQFIAEAAKVENVEGMERDREDFLSSAAASAHDAKVRGHLASIWGWLSRN